MKYLVLTFCFFTIWAAQAQSPIIKITENEFDRRYKILFSAQNSYKVKIDLLGADKSVLMHDEISEKAFVKSYSLSTVPEGRYNWRVTYGSNSFTQEFEIRSLKKLMKESISVNVEDYLLDIDVQEFNSHPLNIFLFNALGDQLDHMFWEPGGEDRCKKISLHDYDAYEIKVEILQNGDLAYAKEFALY